MSYQGKNFIIPCDKGGLTANPNVDTTPAVQMINPSRNLNLQEMGRTPRGGTSVISTLTSYFEDTFSSDLSNWTVVAGTPSISGGELLCGDNDANSGTLNFGEALSGDFDVQVKTRLPMFTGAGCVLIAEVSRSYLEVTVGGTNSYIYFSAYDDAPQTWKIGAGGELSASAVSVFANTIYFRLVRSGSTVYSYYGTDGSSWTAQTSAAIGTTGATVTLRNGGNQAMCNVAYAYFDDFKVNEPALPETDINIRGVYDYTLRNTTQHIMFATDSGEVYKDTENTVKTGMSTANFFSFVTFDNTLFIADGHSVPQTWDGSAASTSDITSPTADWSGTVQPAQFVVHGRGLSERLWAIMAGTSEYNSSVYASADGDGNDFSATKKFDIQTNDGFGIVGGVEFGDRLVCMGKHKAYIIDDTSTDPDDWGYEASQWEGGVAHWRLMTKTSNDIVCMMENGEIYSVSAAENYGDYKAASLTRPANIHKWIKDNIDLAQIDKFHSVYDPMLRAIKFFMVRKGFLSVDMALCYFVDRDPREAWMKHDNSDYDSGYKASCSALVRPSVGNYKVYTGDYSSRVWELESTNKNDNSNGYYAGFKTPAMDCENPRSTKNFKRLWLSVRPYGSWDMEVKWWVDGTPQTATTLSLSGGPVLGIFVLGTDALGGIGILDGEIDLGENGRRVQFECYNETANQSFFLNQMMIDYRELGNEPR